MSLSAVEVLLLSYTFRSHPYQNAVECGCCSKVFFGLRNYSEEAENTAWKPRAGIYLFIPLKFKRCAELDGAARLRLTLTISRSRTAKPTFHRTGRQFQRSRPGKPAFHRTGRHFCSLSNSLWQPMCHIARISIPPCQGGAEKVSPWQAILDRVRSTLSSLPK